MTGRRSCPKCGAVYHIENLKPNVEGICDSDGTRLVQRPDDALEVVANRFKTYFQQTEPVVDYYRENNTVYDIDASKAADKVTDLIFESLNAINLASKREN
jgi:adenylate kinase